MQSDLFFKSNTTAVMSMTNATHTPGPWHIEQSEHDGDNLLSIEARGIRHITLHTYEAPEDMANARLVAAAPELLEALKDLLSNEGRGEGDIIRKSKEKARAIIAKAEGK